MNAIRLLTFCSLAVLAQGALANTIWLKDTSTPNAEICRNSLINNPNNPEKIIGLGGVNRDGSSFTLTIDNPPPTAAVPNPVTPATGACQNLPRNQAASSANPSGNPIVFSGSMQSRLHLTHTWNEWMAQTSSGSVLRKECLDQGSNLSGLSGVINSGQFRLLLSTQFTNGCNMQTQTKITADGQPLIIRTATIFRGGGERPIYSGGYHIFNVNSVPEPGTMLLLAIGGAATLGLLAFTRRRRVKAIGCCRN